MAHFVGILSEFTLTIRLTTDGGDTLIDADELPTAVIKDIAGDVVAVVDGVVRVSQGVYRVQWTPLGAGDHEIHWSFEYDNISYPSIEGFTVFLVADTPEAPIGGPGYAARITVKDQNSAVVKSVGVRVYDQNNEVLVASGYTDANGKVSFSLVAGRYYLRFYGDHVLVDVPSPKRIKVRVPPPENAWLIQVTTHVSPTSPDPNMCRVWGYFRTASGKPLAFQYLRLAAYSSPVGMYAVSRGIGQEPVHVMTDNKGYAQVDLPRGAEFTVVMAGFLDEMFTLKVPDKDSQNLIDMIFPVPSKVTFSDESALAVTVGNLTAVRTYALEMSDGNAPEEPLPYYVQLTSSDEAVAKVEVDNDTWQVLGVSAGSATISAKIRDGKFLARVPAAALEITDVAVTVT